jgi:hypothetical protein
MSLFSRNTLDFDLCLDDLELRAARDSALNGQWEPTRDLLAATGKDWDRRALRVTGLGEATVTAPSWLRSWLTAEPDCPDALVVLAEAEVLRAWAARGAYYAQYTAAASLTEDPWYPRFPRDQFQQEARKMALRRG